MDISHPAASPGVTVHRNSIPYSNTTVRRRSVAQSAEARRAATHAASLPAFSSTGDGKAEYRTINDFILTAYAISPKSTGKSPSAPDYGITYSGSRARLNRTIAVDPRVIPIGSAVFIEGVGWRLAEDTGGLIKGKHIDVLLPSDHAAIRFGVKRHVRIYVLKDKRLAHQLFVDMPK